MLTSEIRAQLGRTGRTQRHLYTALGWSHPKWRRRMDRPETWTLGEISAVARELGVPVRQLLGGLT